MNRRQFGKTLAGLVGLKFLPVPAKVFAVDIETTGITWGDITRATYPHWQSTYAAGTGGGLSYVVLSEQMHKMCKDLLEEQ